MTKTSTAVLANIPEGAVVQTELTLDGFLAHNPEQPPYLEYEGKGCVRRKMSPNTEHAGIAAELSHRFLAYRDATQRELHVYVELRTNVGGQSKVPDGAVYVDHRPSENQRKQALVVADLSIEIISPGESREQQEAKCEWYIQQGGRFAILIDPQRREALVYAKDVALGGVGPRQRYGIDPDAVISELEDLLPGLHLSPQAISQP